MIGAGRRQAAASAMARSIVLSPISARETRPTEIRKASKDLPEKGGAVAAATAWGKHDSDGRQAEMVNITLFERLARRPRRFAWWEKSEVSQGLEGS